ncbi:DNA double-strand break repair protein Rad50 [Candidatus Phytoplasma pini]|uniref:DNA double-strand break repair rad50 ATPase n=1 Tax=Candidatus Phytoplasma pini TaxID=267362 RepID=A0A559KJD4_9MOLU|nr:DNA double-strand break repair protein Rad50 [Candidatus Phytoplasma pini]TVY12244.1 DNA double-strand break repair rad50 ATPase [Candidatus Phytoplasma pini]
MFHPYDLIKIYLRFSSYLTWFFMATVISNVYFFFKRTRNGNENQQNTTTWKSYFIYFLIFIGLFSFIYLAFFKPRDPSNKHLGQLVNAYDKAIDHCGEVLNNYKGLEAAWKDELQKCEVELKDLYKAQQLTQEQKEKIEQLLKQIETKIAEIKHQKGETEQNIKILEEQKQQKEGELTDKQKEAKAQEEAIKSSSLNDKARLEAELDKINAEISDLIGQISHIKSQISILETKIKTYNEMLEQAEELKKFFKEKQEELKYGENSLYSQILSIQERKDECQRQIDEIQKEMEAIEAMKQCYKELQKQYRDAHSRMETHQEVTRASFSNICNMAFKAADVISDFFPAKAFSKVMDVIPGVTKKWGQRMSAVSLGLHEGHHIYRIFARTYQENSEQPLMLSKTALDSYIADINRDLSELDANYRDREQKLNDYQKRKNSDELSIEFQKSREVAKGIIIRESATFDSFVKLCKQLTIEKQEISGISKLEFDVNKLEEKKELKIMECADIKQELKQKNPNFNKAQNHIEQRRRNKNPSLEIA